MIARMLHRVLDQLGLALDAQLALDALAVRLDRAKAQAQAGRHLLAGCAPT